MSDASAFDFGKFIPGFDFLQKLAATGKQSASPVPGLGSWVAPTVSVDELDKRIQELKAVQFWLDQNATALKATIQALEVQKMTLSALAGMNLSMAEVTKAFTLPTADVPVAAPPMPASAAAQGWPYDAGSAAPAAEAAPAPAPAPASATPPPAAEPPAAAPAAKPARAKAARKPAAKSAAAAPAAGMADPMQWWGALTQQFQQIAGNALREAARATPPEGMATPGDGATSDSAPGADAGPARKPAAKAARKKPAARKPAAKKTSAGKTAAKKATKKPAAAKADAGAKSVAGWPLPPPFKFGR